MNLPVAQSLEYAEPTTHRRGRLAGSTLVRIALGVQLSVTAGLKLIGQSPDTLRLSQSHCIGMAWQLLHADIIAIS
jgi:hypothetical protein